jgi:A/G-specific adenine glycosylase
MNKKEKDFIKTVRDYYRRHGRRSLPWRLTTNPYRILVSEVMLQQTQVERVIPKYRSFLRQFPTMKNLAEASLGEVLTEWQGLGYNRRAKMLHECAKEITVRFRGRTPKSYGELVKLPGVGSYTAGAIMAFAYNEAVPMIETNIRTVFLHHFFHDEVNISDNQLFPLMGIVLDKKNSREWYYALMDYGAHLKKTVGNPNERSRHYTKQSMFKNSDRQIRGAIVRTLVEKGKTRTTLHRELPFDVQRIDEQVERLLKEGMIRFSMKKYSLPN